jgi:hypothetical protein
MAQLYRFYLHVEGGDSRTAALVWADSDSEALEFGFEAIGTRAHLLRAMYDADDEDVFFSTMNVLEYAREMKAHDRTLDEELREVLYDCISEMAPSNMAESTIASQAAIMADDVMQSAK